MEFDPEDHGVRRVWSGGEGVCCLVSLIAIEKNADGPSAFYRVMAVGGEAQAPRTMALHRFCLHKSNDPRSYTCS